MAKKTEQAWRFTQRIEKELQVKIAEKQPVFNEIIQHLAEYRTGCESLIFQDFDFAQSKNVEARLWDAHGKVNNRFRKQLSYFHEGQGKRKPVEQRKTMKHYLEFIKSSQRYYRAFIQGLASHSGGILELDAVAHKFNPEFLPTEGQTKISSELRHAYLLSCHQTLVRLGDLSRYRETELVTKERNWGPAIGYYDLAGTIRPSSGASHNQLAVIALADGNHLRATYHLYRALAVEEPHPTAKGNLEIEFKKILVAWEKGELISNGLQKDTQGPGKALLGWFMRLHARCYKGIDFPEHDELENEVLSQLAIDLKERSLEGTLNKFTLINIAAEYFAGVRLQGTPDSRESMQAFFFLQRFNVKTFFTLLQVLQPELERFQVEEDTTQSSQGTPKGAERITAVARRVLPGLRHYSSWLLTNTSLLIAQVGDPSLNVQIKELWKTYANTLTLLAATFPISALPSIDYLLEEDEDTLGFKPFDNGRTKRRYFVQDTEHRKSKWHDQGVERHHPNIEMLGRVRDFLTDGLELALDEQIPIELIDGTTTFAYREENLPSELLASPAGHHTTLSSCTSIELEEITRNKTNTIQRTTSLVDEGESAASTSISLSTTMNQLVDNLVGSEGAIDSECHENTAIAVPSRAPPTPPSYSFDDSPTKDLGNDTNYSLLGTSTAQDLAQEMHSYSPQQLQQGTPHPLLPSIYNSPFAPTPGEAHSSRPSTAKQMSPLHAGEQSDSQSNMLFLLQQQQPSGFSIQSTASSMPDPSSIFLANTPYSGQGNRQTGYLGNGAFNTNIGYPAGGGRPSTGYGNDSLFDESLFSQYVFNDRPWVGTSPSKRLDFETPPNGQGG